MSTGFFHCDGWRFKYNLFSINSVLLERDAWIFPVLATDTVLTIRQTGASMMCRQKMPSTKCTAIEMLSTIPRRGKTENISRKKLLLVMCPFLVVSHWTLWMSRLVTTIIRSLTNLLVSVHFLRPDQERHAEDGSMVVDVNSSEQALRHQIRQWLSDEEGREDLLNHAIPQKGLVYSDEPVNKGTFYLSLVDLHVNEDKNAILSGNGKCFYSGYKSVLSGVDFQKIKYFVPVIRHTGITKWWLSRLRT